MLNSSLMPVSGLRSYSMVSPILRSPHTQSILTAAPTTAAVSHRIDTEQGSGWVDPWKRDHEQGFMCRKKESLHQNSLASCQIECVATLAELRDLISKHRNKRGPSALQYNCYWLPQHEAAVLAKAAHLIHEMTGGESKRDLSADLRVQVRKDLEGLLQISSQACCCLSVLKYLPGSASLQLLTACASIQCTVPKRLSSALLRSLLQDGGKKLPKQPSRLSDLVWSLAILRAGFGANYRKQELTRKGQEEVKERVDQQTHAIIVHDSGECAFSSTSRRVLDVPHTHHSLSTSQRRNPVEVNHHEQYHRGLGPGAAAWAAAGSGLPHLWQKLHDQVVQCLKKQLQALRSDSGGGPQNSKAGLQHFQIIQMIDLSRLAYAFAVSGSHSAEIFDCIEDVALGITRDKHLAGACVAADLAYSFAKAGRPCPRLMPLLCSSFVSGLSPITSYATSPISRQAMKTSYPQGSKQWKENSSECQCKENSDMDHAEGWQKLPVEGQHVAKLLWATSVLRYKDKELLYCLCSVLLDVDYRLTADELAHVAWGFTSHQHYKPQVYEALANQFLKGRMYGISDSQLAMLACSFAEVGHMNEQLFRSIARLAVGRINRIAAQPLISLAWALTKVRQHNELLLEAATLAAIREIDHLELLQVSELLAALKVTSLAQCSRALEAAIRSRQSGRMLHAQSNIWRVDDFQEFDKEDGVLLLDSEQIGL